MPGWGWAAIVGGVAPVIAVVLAFTLTGSRESSEPEGREAARPPAPVAASAPTGGPVNGPRVWVVIDETGLAAIDPRSGRTTGTLPAIAGKIGAIAAGEGAVWVLDESANALLRVDARRGRLVKRIALPGIAPNAVTVSRGAVWVTVTGETLFIDPDTNRVTRITEEGGGFSLAVQGGYLWATDFLDNAVNRISPSGEVRQLKRRLGGEPRLAAADARRVFVLTEGGNMLRIEQGPGAGAPLLTSVRTGTSDNPGGLAVGELGVWIADDRKISRYDPRTLQRKVRRSIGVLPEAVVADAGAVWVSAYDEALVVRVDPRTGAVDGRFSLPGKAGPIALSP